MPVSLVQDISPLPEISKHLQKLRVLKNTETRTYNNITLEDGREYTIYIGSVDDYNYMSISKKNDIVFIEFDFSEQLQCIYYNSTDDIERSPLHLNEAWHFQQSLMKELLDFESIQIVFELTAQLICATKMHSWLDNNTGLGYSELSKRVQEIDNG